MGIGRPLTFCFAVAVAVAVAAAAAAAAAAAFSATAASDVTTASCATGALRELSVAVVKGNEVVLRMCMPLLSVPRHEQVPRCPQWTMSNFVLVFVCCVVVPSVCLCLCAVDIQLSVLSI
jgi:hypothetical protein